MKILFTGVLAIAATMLVQPIAAEPLGTGTFVGASGHSASGSVTVTKSGGQYIIDLGDDFFQDGAPDPYVSLGMGNKLLDGGLGDVLASHTGAQRYTIDVGATLGDATQVIIWCKRYAVPLGVATLK